MKSAILNATAKPLQERFPDVSIFRTGANLSIQPKEHRWRDESSLMHDSNDKYLCSENTKNDPVRTYQQMALAERSIKSFWNFRRAFWKSP